MMAVYQNTVGSTSDIVRLVDGNYSYEGRV